MTATVHHLHTTTNDRFPAGTVGSVELRDRAGITHRQVDYWTRAGRLHTTTGRNGTGNPTAYPRSEIPVAALMRQLLDAGLCLPLAEHTARDLIATGTARIAGITLHLPQEH